VQLFENIPLFKSCVYSCISETGSSDESAKDDGVADASPDNSAVYRSQRPESRLAGQSSRSSSRQGQKYTPAAASTRTVAVASPVASLGYRDVVRKNRTVNVTLEQTNF